jgi:hypothetical protein
MSVKKIIIKFTDVKDSTFENIKFQVEGIMQGVKSVDKDLKYKLFKHQGGVNNKMEEFTKSKKL